jgi:hypothetical protein
MHVKKFFLERVNSLFVTVVEVDNEVLVPQLKAISIGLLISVRLVLVLNDSSHFTFVMQLLQKVKLFVVLLVVLFFLLPLEDDL